MPALDTLRDNVPFAWRYARSWLADLADELLSIQGGVPPTQSYVTLTGQAVAPANPAVGDFRLYFTNTNLLRSVDGGGVVREYVDLANTQTISGTKTFSGSFTVSGTATFTGGFSSTRTVTHTPIFSSSTGSLRIDLSAPAGANRSLLFQSAGINRWQLLGANNTAESGANAGSDFQLTRFDDAGVSLGTALTISRASGVTTLFQSTIAQVTDATTASSVSPLYLRALSTGTPTTLYGVLLPFQAHSSTNTIRDQFQIYSFWVDATDASRTTRTLFRGYDSNGVREFMRGQTNGSAPLIGFLGASGVLRQTVTGSRGGNAALASFLTALANFGLITDSTTT